MKFKKLENIECNMTVKAEKEIKNSGDKQMAYKNEEKDTENLNWWLFFIVIVILTAGTRFYKVAEPQHVCWDETHFGKMGSWYINRTFFFDVHPPLGKMLIALSGYLTGYDGKFPFEKPGDKYENVNYVGMRVFCTFLGATIVPLSFLTVWDLTKSLRAATVSGLLVLCDIGLLTLNQYILLDPILLCFMMCATWGMARVHSLQNRPFTVSWWGWLAFTGISLACTISVKFVGLFVVLLVGLYTIHELWRELGNLNEPITNVGKHLLARCVCLIVFPILLYMAFFYVHLNILNKSGSGDGFYSSEFQSLLQGNSLHNATMPRQLAYGASITLKNHRTGGGYLHSHWHIYPEGIGARQQQITTYSHKDDNNLWLVKKYDTEEIPEKPVLVKHGDLIRLEHVVTRRNLHSHKEIAPVSKKHYQVTGYGENGTGDANDVWKVLIDHGKEGDVVETVSSKLKFVHYLHHCALTCSGKTLPKWAFNQQEVSCNPNMRDKNALWNIEDNNYAKLPNVSFQVYAPGFLKRFIESHAVMLQGNSDLKVKEGEISSKPWHWPINYRGQFFSGNEQKIYLLGNPIIWWGNLLFLAIFIFLLIHAAVREQRGLVETTAGVEQRRKIMNAGGWLFIGWLLHYVPFWAMTRILYFHHYFPALLFNSMLTAITLDHIAESILIFFPNRIGKTVYHILAAFFISTVVYSFYLFSPLAYGMEGPSAADAKISMHSLRWMDTWEF
ncbi:protein O-mannosyl-transferase 2 [Belonocnema kinseyi]|uniref:protein O-mannosyl-transferase 2 n=1 Tax=Belonocnema kinseyi TaxID=2817044 RepID=UPI00143DA53F|nr:protein O-mannosyl-transferase 2 [Belonocnema kinseyi]XP_033217410.1 protein O-mannosyl-transferase 2 [Belonocnema kinseyi]XP_033217411.1 protein O-mannosyl-transferase 2 [Belonocnema kinseyi]